MIVADNDETPSARDRVIAAAAALGIACHYVHAPSRNISIARNACLDHSTAPLLAFIDDDECASPVWMAALLARLDATGAAAVLGPANASYPDDAPRWAAIADLHSTHPVVLADGLIRTGYSCNVLLRRQPFGAQRFDPALGRSGGEDDVFFAEAVRRGLTIAYAPDAVVEDPVPFSRLTIGWLARRAFRNGQTYARNRLADGIGRWRALLVAALKGGYCFVRAAVALPSPAAWRLHFVRGMLHVGACARYLGRRDLQLY